MKKFLLASVFSLSLPVIALAAQPYTTSDASSVGQAASQSISGASQSGVDINETTTDSGDTPAHQRINENVQAPDIVTGGVDSCVMQNGGSTSFLGIAGGVVLSSPDIDCQHLRDANALNIMGYRQQAVGVLCETPDIKKAMGNLCPLPPGTVVAQNADPVNRPVVQPAAALTTLQTGPGPMAPGPVFSPGMSTDELNAVEATRLNH